MIRSPINQHIISYIVVQQNNVLSNKTNSYSNIINSTKKTKVYFDIFFLGFKTQHKILLYQSYQFFNVHYLRNIFKIKLQQKNVNALKACPEDLTKKILYSVDGVSQKNFGIKYFNEIAHLFLVNI